jgi:SAM-dependent methyltransferase
MLADVGDYYSAKVRQHGATAQGADWRDAEGQERRFECLLGVARGRASGSLAEVGCGYGALADYIARAGHDLAYTGYDISADMIETARARPYASARVTFRLGSSPTDAADYVVASGIFNVRLGYSDEVWTDYVHDTIETMARSARRGFAFNCLTVHGDPERRRPHLYYADPAALLTHCIARHGRHVAVRHDYGLYEFTVLVWKEI